MYISITQISYNKKLRRKYMMIFLVELVYGNSMIKINIQ